MPPEEKPVHKNKLSIDLRLVVVLLLIVIGAMVAIWKPWDSIDPNQRTISVAGEATISAEPDEYVFNPAYEFTSANQDTALADLTKKSQEVVAGLKNLGVEDSQIKNAGSENYLFDRKPGSNLATYTLRLTVTLGDKALAQKVQDYLLTTSPSGQITPNVTFSDAKKKELQGQARDEATKDARAKAEQSAQNLGFSLGKVKEVSDGSGFGVFPVGRAEDTAAQEPASQLELQPGENDLTYTVNVTYYVR